MHNHEILLIIKPFNHPLNSLNTGNEQIVKPQYSVYPNPASDYVNITNCRDTRITLFNMEGKMIMNRDIDDNNFRLDTRSFSKGVYSLIIQGKSDIVPVKLVIK